MLFPRTHHGPSGLALFDAEGSVTRPALLFRAGSYPDKGFAMTPEELAGVPAGYTPVPIDLEHMPTVLDGKLGQVDQVWTPDGGQTLMGRVSVPGWLAKVLGDAPVRLSCAWDRGTKRLAKVSLVRNPRISDAALLSAFSGEPARPRGMAGWLWERGQRRREAETEGD